MANISMTADEREDNDASTRNSPYGALSGNVAAAAAGVVVNGTSGNDVITPAETVPGQPYPGADDDDIYGNGGNDTIDGGAGADEMYGGAGDDTFYVDTSNILQRYANYNVLGGGDRVVELQGRAQGNDQIFSSVDYDIARQFIETLTLTGSDDIDAYGNSQANTLVGNDGDNLLNGRGGADVMRGGAGDDRYWVDDLGDVVDETDGAGGDAGGHDKITFTLPVSFSLAESGANVEDLLVTANYGDDLPRPWLQITGNDLDNHISYDLDGPSTIEGLDGDDKLEGGYGDDQIFGGDGNDILDGHIGDDQLFGGAAEDVLRGTTGTSGGATELTGGADADIFVFSAHWTTLEQMNSILDFDRSQGDRIAVNQGSNEVTFVGDVSTPGFTLTEGAILGDEAPGPRTTQLWSWRDDSTTYLIGDVNSNSTLDADDLVVALTGETAPLSLTANDFIDWSSVPFG